MRSNPSYLQVAATAQALDWYQGLYHGKPWNLGSLETFTSRAVVGHFAVRVGALRGGEERAFFRLLIAVAMFQRRQDQQILRILRSLSPAEVDDLTDPASLLARSDATRCACLRSTAALHSRCDLSKTTGASLGTCSRAPRVKCHLKRHTILLRRYGHFGKVPTSAALSLREQGVPGVAALHAAVWAKTNGARERASLLLNALSRSWRISDKIAAMYLSVLTVPGLSRHSPIWTGVDYHRFIVIDSNTDLFLNSVGYSGATTYDARRSFIVSLTEKLAQRGAPLAQLGPRIVQQAMYTFMSRSNCCRSPRMTA